MIEEQVTKYLGIKSIKISSAAHLAYIVKQILSKMPSYSTNLVKQGMGTYLR